MDEAFCVLPSGALLMREPFYHCISSPEEYKESQVRLDIIGQPEHLTVAGPECPTCAQVANNTLQNEHRMFPRCLSNSNIFFMFLFPSC